MKIPEKDDNYLYIQSLNESNYLSISRLSILYTFSFTYSLYISNIPFIKDNNHIEFINYYDTESDVYINIASSKDYSYHSLSQKYLYIQLEPEIKQVKDSNKIKIKMNSLSYHLYPNQYQYNFITNLDTHFNLDLVLPIICGKKQTDKSLKQTMITIEDDGQKEIIEKEVKLDIKVDKSFSNKMIIAPLIMEII